MRTDLMLTITSIATASSPETQVPSPLNPPTPDTGSDRNSIGFLLNCPSESDFIREFPQSTALSPNNRVDGFSNVNSLGRGYEGGVGISSAVPTNQGYRPVIQESNLDVFLSHLEFQTFEQRTSNWQMPNDDLILWSGSDTLFLDRRILDQRAFDIREKLKYAAENMYHPHPPSKEVIEAIGLVTADNIAANIQLYFRHWHKHGPMVHEATFNPCYAALPLVLSLMSLGGMVSHSIHTSSCTNSVLLVFQRD